MKHSDHSWNLCYCYQWLCLQVGLNHCVLSYWLALCVFTKWMKNFNILVCLERLLKHLKLIAIHSKLSDKFKGLGCNLEEAKYILYHSNVLCYIWTESYSTCCLELSYKVLKTYILLKHTALKFKSHIKKFLQTFQLF